MTKQITEETTLPPAQLENALYQDFIDAAKAYASATVVGEEEDPTIYITSGCKAARHFADITEGVATSMAFQLTPETEALLLLLEQSRKEYDEGKHCSSEELKQRLKEKFS